MTPGAYAVRDLHVGSTDRECIRHVLGKLVPAARQHKHRDARHKTLREALEAHHKHQALVRRYAL